MYHASSENGGGEQAARATTLRARGRVLAALCIIRRRRTGRCSRHASARMHTQLFTSANIERLVTRRLVLVIRMDAIIMSLGVSKSA